jgi:hypothetical protein
VVVVAVSTVTAVVVVATEETIAIAGNFSFSINVFV